MILAPTHFQERNQQTINLKSIETQAPIASTSAPTRLSLFCNGNKNILINTAIVYVRDTYGEFKALRAVLDSASESSFLSSAAAHILGLKRERVNIPICGLNESSLNVKKKVIAVLSDENNDSFWEIDLLIVPNTANLTPSKRLNISNLNIPSQVKLADPSFHIPQKTDVLLGVVPDNNFYNTPKNCFLTKKDILDKTLKRFWEIEEVETTEVYSDELKYCNDHFEKTHLRKPDGKFVVEMPFKPDSSEGILRNSKAITSKRLDQLWTRLERDPAMQTLYPEFLNEYELLQYMEEVKEDSDVENGKFSTAGTARQGRIFAFVRMTLARMRQHGVLRLSSKTTRLRVVFNASAKTSSGLSLNDLLCKGGVIQEDLFSILIRFRNKTAPTKVYELKTVTYGTASAPYLATRVLQQLALDEEKDFPLASEVLLQDFYMDDYLSSASEFSEFEKLKSEITQLLQRGGMTLHKWCSNKAPSTELREFSLDRSSEEVMVKTLGMLWDSSSDSFTYKVTTSTDCNYTKRDVLSQIALIYDPLGLLGPVIAKAKIFMQQLWLLKVDWNETLPPDVSTQWRNFIQTLKDIESIHVPRCFLVVPTIFVVLNGFSDASSKAYGAVIYVQTNETTNQLLCSKSRLAPIKSITIPRLELCSCLLLAKLIHKVFKNSKSTVKETGFLKQREYAKAEKSPLKLVQVKYFTTEIAAIKRKMSVPSTSKLRFLNPFIDKSEGLIRVGGRLAHSNLNFNQKHPIILPNGNKLVKLIFQYYHKRDFHVGPQALLNTVRLKYWPIGGRNVARKVVHECVECFRNNPVVVTQIMGDLPPERVTSSSTFLNVGIDLCGPFEIKHMGQRKGTFQKIYVALFVCMATKAEHIEFVSDLTSEPLIATLKRFFAHRGKSSIIFSDNATNLTGASAEIKRLYKLMIGNENISNMLSFEGITWKFSPPRGPNFGGLWESGVKSFKYHLKRVVGSTRLTLEEFLTVIT
ncbi:integrase catalytic domain-containing protein [Trichonephila clavipes]|nr:integrase catalytic domain-containing protein [Trichonephila clavipes]